MEWEVTLPISGKLIITVNADSESAAIREALGSTLDKDMIQEWEAHKEVVKGNVFYGLCRQAEAEMVGDDDDEDRA